MERKKNLKRLIALGVVILVVFLGYLYRLMQMQIAQGAEYLAQAEAGTVREQVVNAVRGEIVDRYGRPMAGNRSSYNIVLDGAYLPEKTEANTVILRLMELLEQCSEEWIDQLPVTLEEPFAFEEGKETEVSRLKAMFKLNEYSTCQDVMYWVTQRYQLGEYDESLNRYVLRDKDDPETILASYTTQQMRRIAGVRYGMDLIEFGEVQRPQMGITAASLDGPEEAMADYAPASVLVASVLEGGPAEAAGLMQFDCITAIDGVKVTDMVELTTELDQHKDGDVVRLTVVRYDDPSRVYNLASLFGTGSAQYPYGNSIFGYGYSSGGTNSFDTIEIEVTLKVPAAE